MSKKSSTFAPEIGKKRIEYLLRQNGEGNVGVRPLRDSRSKKHIPRVSGEKRGALPISGSALFVFLKYETDIYFTLGNRL